MRWFVAGLLIALFLVANKVDNLNDRIADLERGGTYEVECEADTCDVRPVP